MDNEKLLHEKVVKELGYSMNMPNENDVTFLALWVSRRADGSLKSTCCEIKQEPLTDELRETIATILGNLANTIYPEGKVTKNFPHVLECPECGAITFTDHESFCSLHADNE